MARAREVHERRLYLNQKLLDCVSHEVVPLAPELFTPTGVLQESKNAVLHRNALVVSDGILRKQERFKEFERRRHSMRRDDDGFRATMLAGEQAAEARCAARRNEIRKELHRKGFLAHQRRCEAHKNIKLRQQEQERLTDEFYASRRTERERERDREKASGIDRMPPSTMRRSQVGRSISAPLLSSRPATAPGMVETSGDEIVRNAMRSHNIFMARLEKWEQRESENDKSTGKLEMKVAQRFRRQPTA